MKPSDCSEAGVWAIVPAAGAGQRLPGPSPKQYRPLAGRRVLDHVLATLLAEPRLRGVMVALSPDDAYWPQGEFAQHSRVRTCVGGQERADSVLAGLDALAEWPDAPAQHDGVLVHDAARALLSAQALSRLLDTPLDQDGALLAWPAQDTLKRSEDGLRVAASVDRSSVWLAQTPQYFQFGPLRQALRSALQAGELITDESSCMELAGFRPRLIAGDGHNFKITTPADFALAAALMESL